MLCRCYDHFWGQPPGILFDSIQKKFEAGIILLTSAGMAQYRKENVPNDLIPWPMKDDCGQPGRAEVQFQVAD